MLNLADQHSLVVRDSLPTVRPSILVADAPCLSHFWLTNGNVSSAEKWSKDEVNDVMAAQLQRHLEGTGVPQRTSFWRRILGHLRRLFDRTN